MPIEFETPLYLFLLLLLPFVLLILRVSLVDAPPVQRALSTLVRMTVVLLLILALAGTIWVTQSDELALFVIVDVSDSVPEDAADQVAKLYEKISHHAQRPDLLGMVTFGNDAAVSRELSTDSKDVTLGSASDTSNTSIENAILHARKSMPSSTVNRVLLLSDGNETRGDGIAAAQRAAARGIDVYTQPYEVEVRAEVLLEDLDVPSEVKRGQSFTISVVAQSTVETTSEVSLYRDGFKVAEKSLELEVGPNAIVFEETKPSDGLVRYEARILPEEDFFADNNVASGTVYVAGEPRILLLEGEVREARHLARALEAENIRVEVREGKGLPATLEGLTAFDAILLSDVAATEFSIQQMNMLRSYIEDLGGGFIMIGGEESFGLGGYYRTAIEDALPVRMRSEKKKDKPSLAMMLIVDKSGSMQGDKMELAKEAGIATVELLGERDYVGVIVFDGEAYWAVDLQSAGNTVALTQTIEMIEAGGGTNIYPALEEAYGALDQVTATFKHAILLTDGHSQQGDYNEIVQRMGDELITVSTVAVGEGSDTQLLQDIARWGKGRYYFTADPFDIPQIFTKETMTASKSSLIEEPFLPQVYHTHQTIQSLDWENAPFLFGYVVTTPKATSEVLLATERGDPLLAMWRYGLGKTVAFTSDAKSRWASDWVSWPGFGKFWAQLVRDTMRTTQSQGTSTSIEYAKGKGTLSIDSVDANGNFVNGLHTTAQFIGPDLDVSPMDLPQYAPGRYTANVDMEEVGTYLFKVRQSIPRDGGEAVADFTRAYTVSYQPEYRHLGLNEEFLKDLAQAGGGRYSPTLEALLQVGPDESVPVRKRLWPWLLGAAVILFILDVALRRLDLASLSAMGSPQRYG